MSKGTILYIGGFELPDKNAAAHRVIANGKILSTIGYNVVFIGVSEDNNIIQKQIQHYGFDTYATTAPRGVKKQMKYFYDTSSYLKILNSIDDLTGIICYNMPSGAMYNLKKYGVGHNIKIYADVTEWYLGSLKSAFILTLFKRVEYKIRMFYAAKKLDGVIAISSYLSSYFDRRNTKTIVIPPLVDASDDKWMFETLNIDTPVKIVYAGGAFSIKNAYVKDRLDLVIEALSILKNEGYNFIFNVFGTSLNEFNTFYPKLKDNVKSLDLSLVFHGKVAHLKAIDLVKKSDYSIFIRSQSKVTMAGFPTKFVESITSGTMVLTNRNSNVADFLIEGENGYFINIDSMETIVSSLKKPLSVDRIKLAQMKKKTYDSRLFDYRNYIKEFEKMF